jgi:hypothetical protein
MLPVGTAAEASEAHGESGLKTVCQSPFFIGTEFAAAHQVRSLDLPTIKGEL